MVSECSSRVAKSGSYAHEFFIGNIKYTIFNDDELSIVTDGDRVIFEYKERTLKSGYRSKYNAVFPETLVIQAPVELEEKVDGFVYILSNRSMPGLLKVGYTTGAATKRADALSRVTGIPTGFKVEWTLPVYGNPKAVEQTAHAHLAKYLHGKEFFKVSLKVAKEACVNSFAKLYPEQASLMDEALSIRAENELKRRSHLAQMATEKEKERKEDEARKSYEESNEGMWRSKGICRITINDFKNEPDRRNPSIVFKFLGARFEDFMEFKIKPQQSKNEITWCVSMSGRKSERIISEYKYLSVKNDCLAYVSMVVQQYEIHNYRTVIDIPNCLIEAPPVPPELPSNYISDRVYDIGSMDDLIIRPEIIKPRKRKF